MLNEERYKFYNLKDQYLQHSYTPKNPHKEHKYVDIVDGRYIYPEDLKGSNKSKKAKSVPSKAPSPIHLDQKPKTNKVVNKKDNSVSSDKTAEKAKNVKRNNSIKNGTNKAPSVFDSQSYKNAQADYVMEYSNLIRQADAKTAAEKYFKEDENVDYLIWMIEDGLESGTLSYKNGKFTSTDKALEDDIKHTANWIKGWCDKIGAQSGSGQNMERELKKLIQDKFLELGQKYSKDSDNYKPNSIDLNNTSNDANPSWKVDESNSKNKKKGAK